MSDFSILLMKHELNPKSGSKTVELIRRKKGNFGILIFWFSRTIHAPMFSKLIYFAKGYAKIFSPIH